MTKPYMRQLESIFWGIIAALGALVIELIAFIGISAYINPDFTLSFSQFFIVPQFIIFFACIEELFKYIIISKRIEMLSLEKTYVINSLLVGLGFFGVELILISMSTKVLPTWTILAEIAILHMGTSGLIGYVVAIKNPKKFSTLLYVLPVAVFFHASYNLLTIKREYWQNYAIFALLGLLILINISNLLRISRKLAQQ